MEECSGTSVGASQTAEELVLPSSSTSTSSFILPRSELLDGTFFKYLPQESTADDVTALCKMCLPMNVKITGPDECSISFIRHLKRKHGEHSLNQYKKFIKKKKDDAVYKKNNKNSEVSKIADEQLKKNIVNYIIGAMIPLEYINNPYFFSFLENFDVSQKYLKNISSEKIERYLDEEFESQMNIIKSYLINANNVCTSCDVWKRRDKQYLSCTAHWFTEDYNQISVALCCMEYEGIPPYDDIKQVLNPIFAEFDLCDYLDRDPAIFIEDCRVFIEAFNSYGLSNESIECKDPRSIKEIIFQPGNTESTGSLLIWYKDNIYQDYSVPDVIMCSGRRLRLTATFDFMHILYNSPISLIVIHEAALKKCNYLWTAAGYKENFKIIVDVLGHNLIRPNANRWNSLYDAFRQILTLKPKNKELHVALGLGHVISDEEFKYIEEHLRSTMPVVEAVDILMSKTDNYYGIVLPCLTALVRKLKEMVDKSDMIYCNNLVLGFKHSVEKRFKTMIDLNNGEAVHPAIAAISCPRFKNKWLADTDYQQSCGVLNVFQELIRREIIEESAQAESPENNNTEKELFALESEKGEQDYLTSPSEDHVVLQSENIMLRYFADKSEDLEMLDRYPAIKRMFYEFNAPLASALPVNTILDSEEFMRLTKTNEIEEEKLLKRVIMKYNLESMKYLRRND